MFSYNPPRTRNLFKKGEPFSFSRSKVDSFLNCPKCFYIDRVFGVDSPPGFPFNINSAVDSLLKESLIAIELKRYHTHWLLSMVMILFHFNMK